MKRKLLYTFFLAGLLLVSGCRKYLDLPLPVDNIAGDAAFTTDKSSAAVLNNLYGSIPTNNEFDGTGIGYQTGLYTDELFNLVTSNAVNQSLYTNTVLPTITGAMWTKLYQQIYIANLVIEGVSGSTTLVHQNQWLGEAYFMRAFLHFYVMNLFGGDVPIVTSSDYTVSNKLLRSPAADVYKQIVSDLQKAQSLLTNDYMDGSGSVTNDHTRPNKAAATAMLARVYLYTKDWTNAEAQADSVISNPDFQLPALSQVFLAASPEAIFSLAPTGQPVADFVDLNDGIPASVPGFPAAAVYTPLSDSLVAAFEPGDARLSNWTTAASSGTVTYHFAYKYKSNNTGDEYIVILRLAEQYLIRAEARAQLNNVNGAQDDLDMVRRRAALDPTTAANKDALLAAVMHERQVELFLEHGHRMLDLRRTGALDTRMTVISPLKGGVAWQTYMQWWPIPTGDIYADPSLTQTPGY